MRMIYLIFILSPCILLSQSGKMDIKHQVVTENKLEDNWFGKDKAKHFIASFLLAGAGQWVSHYKYKVDQEKSMIMGVSFSLSLGFLKEIKDKKEVGHFSLKDMIVDFLGALFGVMLLRW